MSARIQKLTPLDSRLGPKQPPQLPGSSFPFPVPGLHLMPGLGEFKLTPPRNPSGRLRTLSARGPVAFTGGPSRGCSQLWGPATPHPKREGRVAGPASSSRSVGPRNEGCAQRSSSPGRWGGDPQGGGQGRAPAGFARELSTGQCSWLQPADCVAAWVSSLPSHGLPFVRWGAEGPHLWERKGGRSRRPTLSGQARRVAVA